MLTTGSLGFSVKHPLTISPNGLIPCISQIYRASENHSTWQLVFCGYQSISIFRPTHTCQHTQNYTHCYCYCSLYLTPEFTWVHLGPPGFTLVYLGLPGSTWVYLGSPWFAPWSIYNCFMVLNTCLWHTLIIWPIIPLQALNPSILLSVLALPRPGFKH